MNRMSLLFAAVLTLSIGTAGCSSSDAGGSDEAESTSIEPLKLGPLLSKFNTIRTRIKEKFHQAREARRDWFSRSRGSRLEEIDEVAVSEAMAELERELPACVTTGVTLRAEMPQRTVERDVIDTHLNECERCGHQFATHWGEWTPAARLNAVQHMGIADDWNWIGGDCNW